MNYNFITAWIIGIGGILMLLSFIIFTWNDKGSTIWDMRPAARPDPRIPRHPPPPTPPTPPVVATPPDSKLL